MSDGDTVRVMRDGKEDRVRLYGVDAPEKSQAYGAKAKQLTSDLVFGKTVQVHVLDKDRYGRTIGRLRLPDGRDLSQELVRAGLAWWYRQFARSDQDLASLENEARAAKRGLWSEASPTPPWEFRKAK